MYSDDIIPPNVRSVIKQRLDHIASLPDKDWHPGSDQKVLDLIHPSLYCYVEGVSPLYPQSPYAAPQFDDVLHSIRTRAQQPQTQILVLNCAMQLEQ